MSLTGFSSQHKASATSGFGDGGATVLNRIDHLGISLPVIARLLEQTASAKSSQQICTRAIESDPDLRHIVDSVAWRVAPDLDAVDLPIEHLVEQLGQQLMRHVVVVAEAIAAFAPVRGNGQDGSLGRGLWTHNVAVACAAAMLADAANAAPANAPSAKTNLCEERAFICGLLHDVGKLALYACMPKAYARVRDHVDRAGGTVGAIGDVCEIERDLFGLDHTVAGRRLLETLGMPQAVVECAWLHHQSADSLPSWTEAPEMVQLVQLADQMVSLQRLGFSGGLEVTDCETLCDSLGIPRDVYDRVAAGLTDHLAPFGTLLADGSDGRSGTKPRSCAGRRVTARSTVRRPQMFYAPSEFAQRLSGNDRIADVCAEAADAVREWTDATEVLAIATTPSEDCLIVAVARRQHGPSAGGLNPAPAPWHAGRPPKPHGIGTRDVIGWGVESILATCRDAASQSGVAPAIASGIAPVIAPASCESLWYRCVGSHATRRVWLLPLTFAGRTIGGVLLNLPEDPTHDGYGSQASAFQSDADWTAISLNVGAALASAMAREESERRHDELLDAQRRQYATQPHRLRTRSLRMVAEMAAGAAHEINNPLSVISGRAQMLLSGSPDAKDRKSLEAIVDQAHKASEIVLDLMDFAKPAAPKPTLLHVADLVEAVCQHWRSRFSLGSDQLTATLADARVGVYADSEQVRAILDAAIENALTACGSESARIEINCPSCASDEMVRIAIADNGPGISRDVLEHAIDPFYSHHRAGRRRGLGLSRAHRFAEINGGTLWLESTPQIGTTLHLALPAHPPHAPS